jgi:hypothetical protein
MLDGVVMRADEVTIAALSASTAWDLLMKTQAYIIHPRYWRTLPYT